jgi:hypothetical protein
VSYIGVVALKSIDSSIRIDSVSRESSCRTRVAFDNVIATSTVNDVASETANDHVVAIHAEQQIVTRSAVDQIATAAVSPYIVIGVLV